MEHPLITDIDHLTLEELQTQISDLNRKLSFAMRIGNGQLANQIRLALNTFSSKYQEKVEAQYAAQNKNGKDFSDKINIS